MLAELKHRHRLMTRRTKHVAVVGLALCALVGCSSTKEMFGVSSAHVPEGSGVEEAPYPSLATAPEHVPPINQRNRSDELPERRRGQEVEQEMTREAARLRAAARRLDNEKAGGRVLLTQDQRASEALAKEEAAVKAVDASEAARLRAEIEAELNEAFGESAAPDAN